MKTAPAGSGQRAKCVGWKTGVETAVRHPGRIKPSRDGHPRKVQPDHRLAQGHRCQAALPEPGKICRTAQIRKPRSQPKTEGLAPFLQPTPPAAHRVTVHATSNRSLMQRATAEQAQQHNLLHGPVVPTPRGDTVRQPRTGLAAALAKEPGYGDRIQEARRLRTPVCLARITAMTPKPGQTALRTGRRPVDHRITFQGVTVLWKGENRRHNPLNRPVSSVRVKSVKNFPR